MLIKVINPNTTLSMTKMIGESARAVVGPGVTVEAVSPSMGPASIESHYDDALSVPGVLQEVLLGEEGGADGYVIACFGDPGLLAAREVAAGPVVGIAEAGMKSATYLGRTFSVVTTLGRTVGHTWELAHRYGVGAACAGVYACEIPVLDLETDPAARSRILAACRDALVRDGSDVVVLGCAGMADFCVDLSASLGVPVIDGVAAATATVQALVTLGLRTSKRLEFASPAAKTYDGMLQGFAPPR
ncbi:MAG: Asp/Glu racemase [Nocardioidaceae bacterium]|nr:Asp/Glu racemase [Nocardioidaceae bacterium]